MYAIVELGGKQYQVEAGDRIKVEKMAHEVGEEIAIDRVLAVGGDDLKIGTPYVEGATVKASVKEQGKDKKITVGKFRPKSGYRRTRGHRQPYTLLEIEDVQLG